MSFYVIYAGESNENYNLLVYSRPDYRTAAETVDEYKIPGRECYIYQRSGNFALARIDVTFNYIADWDEWGENFRRIVCWLRKAGDLQFSDDLSVFRKVRYVDIGDNARTVKRYGKFKASFMCYPGEYYVSGQEFYDAADVLSNPYSMCRPVYRITGNGGCTLTVNGNEMTAAVDTDLYIDTDRKIAYRSDGETANTSVAGDYDALLLEPGENTISFDGSAKLEIQPNWRVL